MKRLAARRSAPFGGDALRQASKKFSASPLIDPAVCSLVLVAPSDDFFSNHAQANHHRRKNEILLAAARIVDVPVFQCFRTAKLNCIDDVHRVFCCSTDGCIWKNEAFLEALDSEDRSVLILAGYWLDFDVTVASLYALADCYDVYIPLDASPGQSKEAARLAEARLLQAGATPLLTEHVLREWAMETSSAAQRDALTALLRR